jgi:hypothetical protein
MGRMCPLRYRYSPKMLVSPQAVQQQQQSLDCVYLVGGLYGTHEFMVPMPIDIYCISITNDEIRS